MDRPVGPLAPAPAGLLTRPQGAANGSSVTVGPTERIAEGGRHNAMLKLAGSMRRAGAAQGEIEAALLAFNDRCDPPEDVAEVLTLARDVVTRWEPKPDAGSAPPPKQRKGELATVAASDVRPQIVEWLWKGWLPLGQLSLLAGLPGLGKTTLDIRLAAEITRGTLPGACYGTPGTVLMASLEDALAPVLVPRLMAAGADLTRVHFIRIRNELEGGALDLTRHLPEISDMSERLDARFLIIDPLVATMPSGSGVSSNSDQDVRSVLAPLADIAERRRLSVLANMHFTKSAMNALIGVGGSIGFVAAARSVLIFGADPRDPRGDEGPSRVVAHRKCNVGKTQQPLQVSILGTVVETDDGRRIDTSMALIGDEVDIAPDDLVEVQGNQSSQIQAARNFLVAVLADGPMPAKELRKLAEEGENISWRTLERAKGDLNIEPYQENRQWLWRLPTDQLFGDDDAV
jgi:putative DNA primase/helicase